MQHDNGLTKSQVQAIGHIREYALQRKIEAQQVIDQILKMSNIAEQTFQEAYAKLRSHARVALHFHPDRPAMGFRTVAHAFLEQGSYRSQFETGISNGSLTAYPGGVRDLWEKDMFGGAYHMDGMAGSERPKYGALDFGIHPDGSAPSFGSCYFLLYPKVSSRSTFTYGGSQDAPPEKGTLAEFDDMMAAILKDTFSRDYALGAKELTPSKWVHHLLTYLEQPYRLMPEREPSRNLFHYIEAQVHGSIHLKDDVECLVADPSFKGMEIGNILEQLCQKYGIKLEWHQGFQMNAADVPSTYRGPAMPSLARRIASNQMINARVIGEAVQELMREPERWKDRGTQREMLQELKYIWHVLVRFGEPAQ
jgi:hypothetical protein